MIDYHNGITTIGTYVLYIGMGFLIGLTALAIAFLYLGIKNNDGETFVFSGVTLVLLLALIGTVIGTYWPFDSTFHKYYPVNGVVEVINKRMVASDDGKGMQERYVIKFKESNVLYGCDDTRCALAETNKHLELMCKKEWQYSAQYGWVCRYNQEN